MPWCPLHLCTICVLPPFVSLYCLHLLYLCTIHTICTLCRKWCKCMMKHKGSKGHSRSHLDIHHTLCTLASSVFCAFGTPCTLYNLCALWCLCPFHSLYTSFLYLCLCTLCTIFTLSSYPCTLCAPLHPSHSQLDFWVHTNLKSKTFTQV